MTVVNVICVTCGDRTVFTDGTPDNDHITLTNSGPNKYKCNGCGAQTDDGPDRFREF
jgi:hypothetical protein